MPHRQRSFFGASLGDALVHTPSSTGMTRYASNQPLSPRKQALFEEADVQNLTIDATSVKTAFGMTKFAELHQHGACLFGDTLETIFEVKEQVTNKEAQPIVAEFTTRQISLYGRQTLSALEVGGAAIGFEINRALYMPPVAPERKSLLQRLFG